MAESRHAPTVTSDPYFLPIIRLPVIVDPRHLHLNGKLLSDEQITQVATVATFFRNTKISKRLLPLQAKTYSIVTLQGKLLAVYLGAKHHKLLGKGSYGKVKLAQDCQTGEFYALKIQPESLYESFRREIEFHSTVGLLAEGEKATDLSFTHYYSSRKNQHQLISLMRYVHGMSLETQNVPLKIPPLSILLTAIQLAEKLDFLHTQLEIIHSDLHLENVLFDYQTNKATIIDYGLAKKSQNGATVDYGTGFCTGSRHIPPEARDRKKQCEYSGKTDAYSFGQLLRHWFRVRLYLELTDKTNPREFSPFISQFASAIELQALLRQLLATNPCDRPTLENVRVRLQQIFEIENAHAHHQYTCAMIPVPYYLSIPIEFKNAFHNRLQHFDCVFLVDDQLRHPLVYSTIYQAFEKQKIYIYPNLIFNKNNLFLIIRNMIDKLLVDYHSPDAIYCLNLDGTLWPASQVLPQLDALLATQATINLSNNRYSLFSSNATHQKRTETSTEPSITASVQRHA